MELGTKGSDLAAQFGEVDYELGIIAGDRSLDPFSSWLIGRPNDGKVSIDSTRLSGMSGHVVIPATHTFITANQAAWRNALDFLRNGSFSRNVEDRPQAER